MLNLVASMLGFGLLAAPPAVYGNRRSKPYLVLPLTVLVLASAETNLQVGGAQFTQRWDQSQFILAPASRMVIPRPNRHRLSR